MSLLNVLYDLKIQGLNTLTYSTYNRNFRVPRLGQRTQWYIVVCANFVALVPYLMSFVYMYKGDAGEVRRGGGGRILLGNWAQMVVMA